MWSLWFHINFGWAYPLEARISKLGAGLQQIMNLHPSSSLAEAKEIAYASLRLFTSEKKK
jgi:hypothetical protein